jgi:hypothetical protein
MRNCAFRSRFDRHDRDILGLATVPIGLCAKLEAAKRSAPPLEGSVALDPLGTAKPAEPRSSAHAPKSALWLDPVRDAFDCAESTADTPPLASK